VSTAATGNSGQGPEDTAPVRWVFGYGSLIWRPDFPYEERVEATLPGYRRAFCRYSFRHRGTPEHPGLVVGLVPGGACVGMGYRFSAENEAEVLAYLDEREGAGYLRLPLPLHLHGNHGAPREVTAWAYVPNPEHPSYFGQTDTAELVRLVATGRGESGTALDYLRDLMAHLDESGVEEPLLRDVLARAELWGQDAPPTTPPGCV